MHLLYMLVNVINMVCSLRLSLLKQGLSEPEFYGDLVYKFRKYFGRRLFWSVKNFIRYKRTGYNIYAMRQSACLVVNPVTVNNFPLVQPVTTWRPRPKHVQYNWLGLDALSLVWPIGVQLLDICCSSVSVRVLLFNSHLVSTQCCWILIYIIAVLMHRLIRSPSRGPNTLYVFESQQNLGRGLFQRKTGLSPLPPSNVCWPFQCSTSVVVKF